jgi:hypothetical protein
LTDPLMKGQSGEAKEAKDTNLNKQTCDNDTTLDILDMLRNHHSCSPSLNAQCEYVTGDEDQGQTIDRDKRVAFASDRSNDASQSHIDRGGEECRGDENVVVLDNEWEQ